MTEKNSPPSHEELASLVIGILDGLGSVLSPQVMQIIGDRAKVALDEFNATDE
jgi:hypothetical protein